jgi:hypothetical protein
MDRYGSVRFRTELKARQHILLTRNQTTCSDILGVNHLSYHEQASLHIPISRVLLVASSGAAVQCGTSKDKSIRVVKVLLKLSMTAMRGENGDLGVEGLVDLAQ